MAIGGVTSGTGEGLLEFLGWAAKKGNLNSNTAAALRAAARELLAVEAEDGNFTSIEIRSLDIDDLGRRFANLRAAAYAPASLETYQSRFRRAVDMYKRFLENPATWRPEAKERAAQRAKSQSTGTGTKTRTQPADREVPTGGSSDSFVVYPFPIRKGVMASLSLPADMTPAEAKRLSAFLESLAMEEQKLLTAGRHTP